MGRARELYERLKVGGENEVDNFIAQKLTEELFLDYKRSANNGVGSALDQNDKNNLGKAISGFGNSEGGVIVWGVDCRQDRLLGDVPQAAIYIENPIRFKSLLEQITSGLTVPAHSGVLHHAIECAAGNKGFVITLIPSGEHAPYQAVNDVSYYIRSGSNFAKTPHAVLAGMFGKRPQPSIKNNYIIPYKPAIKPDGFVETQIGINLRNFGRGIAESVFLNFMISSHPGDNCKIELQPSEDTEIWWGQFAFGIVGHFIMKSDYRVPPGAAVMPLSLKVRLKPPFISPFSFKADCGASGCEIWEFGFTCESVDIERAYNAALEYRMSGSDTEENLFNEIFFDHLNKLQESNVES